MIGLQHVEVLRDALAELLGVPVPGTVAFVRCLPSDLVDALIEHPNFDIPGWGTSAVLDVAGVRQITADQAVELRENKANPLFFLIDPIRAGAGLDGIYSAAREIGEAELFEAAHAKARSRLRGKGRFLSAAEKRAKRLGRRHRLTPWQVFDFLIAVNELGCGAAIARLGLWPIATSDVPEDRDLDLAAELAQRILFAPGTQAIGDRVRALLLDDPSGTQAQAVERFLRGVADLPPLQAALALEKHKDLWLGELQPRFSGETLKEISLVSWRGPRGALTKWSGLSAPEEEGGKPRLILDTTVPAKDQGRLEIRWTTQPDLLAKGVIQYHVAILAGDQDSNEELAAQTVAHREKSPQKAVFTRENFEELDDDAKFEAFVQVAALGAQGVPPVASEEFVLAFGQRPGKSSAASGQIVRSLVEGAIGINERATFDEAVRNGHQGPRISEDKKGYITWRTEAGRSVRVLRPALIRQVEEDWRDRNGSLGRWVARVRADGSLANRGLEFRPLGAGAGEASRAAEAGRKLAGDLGPFGFLARIQSSRWVAGEEYVNAWVAALDAGAPELALHGTVEVQSISGRCVGLIVTPLHPLRLAWHAAYDQLAAHARYEQGLSATAVRNALKPLDSSHFPFSLPGIGDARGFVFADSLGFHAVAMTPDGEAEPKAAVAQMAVCLGGARQGIAPSVGAESASVLAREIGHYLACHRRRIQTGKEVLDLLNIQAWRAGDAMTVARALGEVLRESVREPDQDEEEPASNLCFTLDLVHPPSQFRASGGFLSEVGRRRRAAGGSVLAAEDRWMTETVRRPGEIILPRLRWAQRDESKAPQPAHLSLAFDVFTSRLEARPASELGEDRPLHAFGLAKAMERHVTLSGDPEWILFAPPRLEGERAPDNRAGTDRLLRLDTAVARATARFLGGRAEHWPVLATRLTSEGREWIDRLHEQSDWVVTVDRNACIEYFDAPRDLPEVYERFVIDAVPDRADLGALQLVTTTANLDEVCALLDEALNEMGLESSEQNSRCVLAHLKALSGRLAIRLASPAERTGELIALAIVQAHCSAGANRAGGWLDLREGFFIPIDEIADLVAEAAAPARDDASESAAGVRLVYVCAPPRRPLEFRFVEVQHRLHLKTARQPELLQGMLRRIGAVRHRWHDSYFSPDRRPAQRSIQRSQLSRILRFYADRASRHCLSAEAYRRLKREIDQLVLREDYPPADVDRPEIAYVFCPEHRAPDPEMLYAAGGEAAQLWLFGPSLMLQAGAPAPVSQTSEDDNQPADEVARPEQTSGIEGIQSSPKLGGGAADVVLGSAIGGSDDVPWRVSIEANPHLMVVGLPGMGKTTCLVNICRQLLRAGINPIVFAYHEDIEAKLRDAAGELIAVDYNGLGFNPLRIDTPEHTAHIDVAGALRDIFAAIFPDLGDLQLEELRQAVKQSYDDLGWQDLSHHPSKPLYLPSLRAFFDILSAKPKPNLRLLARMRELADYGFFDASGERASLLEAKQPVVVRIHGTANSVLQSAFSSFILYSLYKDMFRRGVQAHITHAIIFDEAHRAARLRLIPRFAKECRKFGLALILASQEAKDFNESVFSAVANYLILRVTEGDARKLARMTGSVRDESRTIDRLKSLERYTGLYFGEGRPAPVALRLLA